MKKLICFTTYPPEAPSVYHRIEAYRPFLKDSGIELEVISFLTSSFFKRRRLFGFWQKCYKIAMFLFCSVRLVLFLPKAAQADTVIIHREVFPLGKPWLELLISRISTRCYYDIDDAIWFPPSNSINQRAMFWDEQRVPRIMKSVDGIIAGSPYIEQYAHQYNQNILKIPTSFDDLQGLNPNQKNSKISKENRPVIVWIGNWGNACYLNPILPVLERLSERFDFILRLIGGQDIFEIKSEQVSIEYFNWSRALESELLPNSDIGIMPLANQDYEKGKCSFKLIQYMSAGLPVIASPVGMNQQVVTENLGKLADTEEEWYQSLEVLLSHPSLRIEMGRCAYRRYQNEFSRIVNSQRLACVLEE
ncbi:glycosyltransferase [Endozoicomonas arenosclerae]|uniref:glycosyltransferase n=1 Tax=Endozoicomonas arenosclerae TaxID=1633495 RepID=UPI000782C3F0|nr:glycosyltransferase [Endozoicomonas arenosclerae]